MNLSAENVDKIRNYLNDLALFWRIEAEMTETLSYREICLVEANRIKAFLDKDFK